MAVPQEIKDIIEARISEDKGSSKLIIKEKLLKYHGFREGAEFMYLVLEEYQKQAEEIAKWEAEKSTELDPGPVVVDL